MEHKIGEIFEYNGEWYQCVETNDCANCAFKEMKCYLEEGVTDDSIGECCHDRRRDNKNVIFKKLEKVGEPYMTSNKLIQRYKIYPTTCCINVYGWYYQNLDVKSWTIDIEIEQNKEDMEEKKLNLKPFNLEAAKAGKPVCTRDGRKARIICFDKQGGCPIIALVETFVVEYDCIREEIYYYTIDGREIGQNAESKDDLMMLPEKKEGWINIYEDMVIYESKEEAELSASKVRELIVTAKVKWEE